MFFKVGRGVRIFWSFLYNYSQSVDSVILHDFQDFQEFSSFANIFGEGGVEIITTFRSFVEEIIS